MIDPVLTAEQVVLLVQAIVTLQAVNEGLGTRNADLSGRAISAVEKVDEHISLYTMWCFTDVHCS